jgi:glycosyltransferase involved in cell wall biosynthesis
MVRPTVSIGLPVYNGENFLPQALNSIVSQTYTDFELIISDNGSTDRTREISEVCAAGDKRVRYFRSDANRGAAWNFNNVFELSVGKYFKWAAHDDVCAPEFVARCVEVLEADPGIVVCFSRTVQIDSDGRHERKRDHIDLPNLASPRAHERFHDIIANRHGCEAVFGVIRADVLRRTPLIGNYIASDKVLLALLSIYGRFHELPDYLFFQREHEGRSVKGRDHEVTAWFDPSRGEEIVFPFWRISWEYLRIAVKGTTGLGERLRCLWEVARWGRANWRGYKWDLSSGVNRVLLLRGSRPIYRYLHKWLLWGRQRLPNWLTTSTALVVMLVVEGFHWALGGEKGRRWNGTKKISKST